jgi:hypothetical protein
MVDGCINAISDDVQVSLKNNNKILISYLTLFNLERSDSKAN